MQNYNDVSKRFWKVKKSKPGTNYRKYRKNFKMLRQTDIPILIYPKCNMKSQFYFQILIILLSSSLHVFSSVNAYPLLLI